jgi:cell division protein FtsW
MWSGLFKFCVVLPIGLVMLLVAQEPDLGTALFVGLGAAIALFAGGWPARNFVLAAGLAVPAAGGLIAMRPYQMERITGFIAAWRDFDLAPYQVQQSLTTLGVGGVNGVGLGSGWQKLSFLPEANTDFVFAVLGEELGLIGTLGLAGLWAALYVTGLRLLAPLDRRSFAYVAGFTLLTQLVLQAAVNIAVVTALLPPKGIAHPLVSYGGSSLMVSVTTLGIIISLARAERES